ncbi:hypothetical protein Sgly_3357 [Syntrophobotulus glycolicus DSM 8271]|uniref:Putative Se/S carrier protein-like domain-containing protein n=1 Tax=Syntrophobotulus glycolicus (strain DSM 8271 / FlGlyR) TaxID=645991 RepID=F0T2Y2_SYNGF|nr:DUF3343 domain-containing protein [Syntrophobotulus glycolicus]ADY57619.1 hypothetical protein Sgly_3357 [Syntrophobotulus glycolicus DSM 8271]
MMEYLALFYTSTGAVKFKRKLDRLAIPVELLPVPSSFSAGCGVAARFFVLDPGPLLDASIEKLYKNIAGKYILQNIKRVKS